MRSAQPQSSVLISGGAAGIGLAIARRFVGAGWRVGIYDVNVAQAEQAAEAMRADGLDAHAGVLDVTDSEQWTQALADFCGSGPLDVLINNAGIASAGPFVQTGLDAHYAMVDVNIKGVLNGCLTAFPYLRRAQQPRVINLCSASAIYGQPDLATYSATKFAVRGLTEALNIEWEAEGVHVSSLMPIFVKTAMVEGISDLHSVKKMGVNLTPEDVADAAWAAAIGRRVVHRVVGRDAAALRQLIRFLPATVTRYVVKKIARG